LYLSKTHATLVCVKPLALFKLYLASLIVFLGIDFIWLTFVATKFYSEQIGFLLAEQPNIIAALIFYLIFVAGLLYFVVVPSLKMKKSSLPTVVFAGALFGLVTYATYDLTNLATIRDWPLLLVFVDLAWGVVISALVSAASYLIGKRLV
jgi:uncharacterized membrane protein